MQVNETQILAGEQRHQELSNSREVLIMLANVMATMLFQPDQATATAGLERTLAPIRQHRQRATRVPRQPHRPCLAFRQLARTIKHFRLTSK